MSKEADVQDFNRRAATYEESRRQSVIFDRVQKLVLNLVAEGTRPEAILDIGCGTGCLLRKARQHWPNARLIGVDPAQAMIHQAAKLLPEAEFHVAMAESLPLPAASFDAAFSTMSFHHWNDQSKGVSEIVRVLRPKGVFVLADIVAPLGLSVFFRHFKRNNARRIREMFAESGLKVELQHRRWLFSRLLVVTIGRKNLT